MNPLLVENGGRTIYFTMSLGGPYDVYLVKATFKTSTDFGDFNQDGVVDAADYAVWRDTLGSTTNLAADGNGNGTIDAGDYGVWKTNFGQTAGTGAAARAPRLRGRPAEVPEPTSLARGKLPPTLRWLRPGSSLPLARRAPTPTRAEPTR